MDILISTVNYNQHNGLNHSQFQLFLEETQTQYDKAVHYLAVRWLSKGAVLKTQIHLQCETDTFMTGKGKAVPHLSHDK
jgi:hypothetical protein